jgi:hypothetical protein
MSDDERQEPVLRLLQLYNNSPTPGGMRMDALGSNGHCGRVRFGIFELDVESG